MQRYVQKRKIIELYPVMLRKAFSEKWHKAWLLKAESESKWERRERERERWEGKRRVQCMRAQNLNKKEKWRREFSMTMSHLWEVLSISPPLSLSASLSSSDECSSPLSIKKMNKLTIKLPFKRISTSSLRVWDFFILSDTLKDWKELFSQTVFLERSFWERMDNGGRNGRGWHEGDFW